MVLERATDRHSVIQRLCREPPPCVVGLDFGFSFPRWYVESLNCASAAEVWELAGRHGEEWLARCAAPLWGRPGRPRGSEEQFRRTETEIAGRAKSVFQVGGAGSVGTGSIRGMPALLELRSAGYSIWPFDEPRDAVVLEIYPRLLTGPGPKSSQRWRTGYLDRLAWPPEPRLRDLAASTEDAFDAAISALRMWEYRADLADLPPARDGIDRLEGRIWEPQKRSPGEV